MERSKGIESVRRRGAASQEKINPKGEEDQRARFYLMKKLPEARKILWDPWPVKKFRGTEVFKAAQRLIDSRNTLSLDHCIDRVVLLPASGHVIGIQGGTGTTDLYSLRSPSMLPRKVHLWQTRGGKVMIHVGIVSKTLAGYLEDLGATDPRDPAKSLNFWKSLCVSETDPKQLVIPGTLGEISNVLEEFQDEMHRIWQAFTVFPFLALPAELRQIVLRFAMGRIAEPYESEYRPKDHMPLSKPNMSLTLTSRQLHNETMAELFSKVTFSFRHHDQLLRFLNHISRASFDALESIELKFNHETLLELFGANVESWRPKNMSVRNSTAWIYLADAPPTTTKGSLRLRHIRICFPHPRHRRSSRHLQHACQRKYCAWALAAMHMYLIKIPQVELDGCIKNDQKRKWRDVPDTYKISRRIKDREDLRAWLRYG